MADDRSGGGQGGWWRKLWRPAPATALGTLLIAGFIAGVVFWGGFNWSLELTNTQAFCISCHEMEKNVFAEYKGTVHNGNRSGVRATCPDCHVPREWQHKIVRKIRASNELWHHLLGTVDTPEKFNAKRLELATNEWRRMKSTDSRECRNCHEFKSMDYTAQEPRAGQTHQRALTEGQTCIDCHRGIAHTLPANATQAYEQMVRQLKTGKP
ncbi:MAG: NapC/NirT family cytochrome c [Burkholderiaceae bacterium]|nr:NapC/NirT family cytochrome c [Burkholderiaceae bacterium]